MTTSSAGTSAESSPRTSAFLSKVAAVLIMLVGAGLVATPLISNLFAVGPAFENLREWAPCPPRFLRSTD